MSKDAAPANEKKVTIIETSASGEYIQIDDQNNNGREIEDNANELTNRHSQDSLLSFEKKNKHVSNESDIVNIKDAKYSDTEFERIKQ